LAEVIPEVSAAGAEDLEGAAPQGIGDGKSFEGRKVLY